MRLGIDASNIRGGGGGTTYLVEMLASANPERSGFSEVVIWSGKDTLKKLPKKPWLTPAYLPALDKSLITRTYWQKTKLKKVAEEHGCDILFCPSGGSGGGFKPYVAKSINLLPFELQEIKRLGFSTMFFKMRLLRISLINSFNDADGIVFLTEYARSTVMKQITTFNGASKTIPFGINPVFYLKPREQKNIKDYSLDNPFKILYVSTVNGYKHQWHVVNAIDKLKKEGIPVSLDLLGGGYAHSLSRLQDTIDTVDPKGEFIHYHGKKPYEEVTNYYHNTDAFLFASSCENLPNILIEAMASGLPIACSKSNPMPEVLRNAGEYFDPLNPNDIADAIRRLIKDVTLREKHANTAYQFSRSYSWEVCANETFDFLARLIDSR